MHLLDASAVLAVLQSATGADQVAALLPTSRVLAVNLEEVAGTLTSRGMPADLAARAVDSLGLAVEPFTAEMAWVSARHRPRLPSGLGLGDRCCLAAGAVLGDEVVTADPQWPSVAPTFGVRVTLIR